MDYNITRFSQEQLHKLQHDVQMYATYTNGLPQSHSEVYMKKGWLLAFLYSYDSLLWGRWDYWMDIVGKGTIQGSGPIPQINWSSKGQAGVTQTLKMFEQCLDHPESTIYTFAEWLLWSLNTHEIKELTISKELNEHYYRKFDLFLVLDHPFDYLSEALMNETGKGYHSGLGYYPTPLSLTQLMATLTYGGKNAEDYKKQTAYDPCVGCGALLLPASNYYLRAYAQDISLIATQLCKIQFLFYAPWFACPANVKGFDEESEPIKLSISPDLQGEGQFAFNFEELMEEINQNDKSYV